MPTIEEQRLNRAKLVAALRSGEYIQGFGRLTTVIDVTDPKTDRHCCLGVACIIAGIPNRISAGESADVRYRIYGTSANEGGRGSSTTHIPADVMEFYGFRTNAGKFDHSAIKGLRQDNLVDLNDIEKWSFDKIAQIIEDAPNGLFEK